MKANSGPTGRITVRGRGRMKGVKERGREREEGRRRMEKVKERGRKRWK